MTENTISTCGQETYFAFRARIVHISRFVHVLCIFREVSVATCCI